MIPDEATVVQVETPGDFPDINTRHHQVFEPMVKATLMFPQDYLGSVLALIKVRFVDSEGHVAGQLMFCIINRIKEDGNRIFSTSKKVDDSYLYVPFHGKKW